VNVFAVPDYGLGRADSADYEDYSQYPDFNELSEYMAEDTVLLVFELIKVSNVVFSKKYFPKVQKCRGE
jgi:hypothetical protein